jgi:ribosomal protein S18 acetylase RimI-like enzyme
MAQNFSEIRDGQPQDAAALADIYARAWELTYRGIIPDRQLRVLSAQHDASWWAAHLNQRQPPLVLEAGGVVAGYATLGRSRGALPFEGEIYELYLAPVYQGVGLGEHLFEAARHRLDLARLRGLVVWALTANTSACEFYRRRGGAPIANTTEPFGDLQLDKTAFGWS